MVNFELFGLVEEKHLWVIAGCTLSHPFLPLRSLKIVSPLLINQAFSLASDPISLLRRFAFNRAFFEVLAISAYLNRSRSLDNSSLLGDHSSRLKES